MSMLRWPRVESELTLADGMYCQFRDLNHGRVNGWEMETACPQAVFFNLSI